MTGYVEYGDDSQQYAAQNRPITAAERAAIERLSAPPVTPEMTADIRRLTRLHQDKNVKPVTAPGAKRVGQTPAVRRALDYLRGIED